MKNENPEDREADKRLLKHARNQVADFIDSLAVAGKKIKAGDVVEGEKPETILAGLKKLSTLAIGIEADLAKRSYEQRSGGEGACALDLDAARREVFDRLAKIADARRGGDVS